MSDERVAAVVVVCVVVGVSFVEAVEAAAAAAAVVVDILFTSLCIRNVAIFFMVVYDHLLCRGG